MGLQYIKIILMEIKYNIPIEVDKKHYNMLMTQLSGIVAGREENGKYFVKVLIMKYAEHVKQILNTKIWF